MLNCHCDAFELLCIEQDSSGFKLFSRSLEYAKQCQDCICNSDVARWTKANMVVMGYVIPDMPKIHLAPYSILMLATRENNLES